jgi:protein gp37
MTANSNIEWTDHTFSPWVGCTKISPACDHCYAEGWAKRSGLVKWGAGEPRRRTSESNWKGPLKWNRQHDEFFAEHGRRQRVFCASLADVFDNDVPPDWRADLLNLIASTPNLDWLLLTKRIGNAAMMLDIASISISHGRGSWGDGWKNVWLGATVCNQEEADRDIPKLLATPARVRFLSIEPMLGPISLDHELLLGETFGHAANCTNNLCALNGDMDSCMGQVIQQPCLNWAIAGGESGHHARSPDLEWFRALARQCKAAGTAFFMKQLGGARDKRGRLEDFPDDLRIREFPQWS